MSYCGERLLVNHREDGREAISLKCRCWSCTDCSPQRKAELIAQACGGRPDMFLTLTIRRSVEADPNAAARKLSHAWRILRLRIMRGKPERDRYDAACKAAKEAARPAPSRPDTWPWRKPHTIKPLPFILAVERHDSGWPHLHILLRCRFIPQAWLSAEMQSILSSPIVDVQRIKHKGSVVSYVCKYIGKDPHRFTGCKRYWQSKDFDLRPPHVKRERAPIQDFEMLSNTSLLKWIAHEISLRRVITRVSQWCAQSRPPPMAAPLTPLGGAF